MSQRLKSMNYPECDGNMNATAHYYMLMKEGNDQYPGEDLHELDYAAREALEGAYGKTFISPIIADKLEQEGISVEETDPTDWSLSFAEDNPLFGWGADPNKPKHYLVKSYMYGRRDRGYETKFKRPTKKDAMDYAKSLASEYVRLPQDHRAEIVVYAVYPSGKEQEVWTSYQPSKIAANNPRRAKTPTRKNTGHRGRRNPIQDARPRKRQNYALEDHAKSPYHRVLLRHGMKYSHSVPVDHYGVKVPHHVYRLGSTDFYTSFYTRPGSRRAVWEGSISGSGRMYQGEGVEELDRYLKGAVKRHSNPRKRRNAKLTAADKAKMPLRDFAIPSRRAYPMHNLDYAKRAIQYGQFRGKRDLPAIQKAVFARYPSLISWWNENHPESPWKTRSSGGRGVLVAAGDRRRQKEKAKRSDRTEIADLKRQIAAAKRKRANPRRRNAASRVPAPDSIFRALSTYTSRAGYGQYNSQLWLRFIINDDGSATLLTTSDGRSLSPRDILPASNVRRLFEKGNSGGLNAHTSLRLKESARKNRRKR